MTQINPVPRVAIGHLDGLGDHVGVNLRTGARCTLVCLFLLAHPTHYVTYQGIPAADRAVAAVSFVNSPIPLWRATSWNSTFDSEEGRTDRVDGRAGELRASVGGSVVVTGTGRVEARATVIAQGVAFRHFDSEQGREDVDQRDTDNRAAQGGGSTRTITEAAGGEDSLTVIVTPADESSI